MSWRVSKRATHGNTKTRRRELICSTILSLLSWLICSVVCIDEKYLEEPKDDEFYSEGRHDSTHDDDDDDDGGLKKMIRLQEWRNRSRVRESLTRKCGSSDERHPRTVGRNSLKIRRRNVDCSHYCLASSQVSGAQHTSHSLPNNGEKRARTTFRGHVVFKERGWPGVLWARGRSFCVQNIVCINL